MTTRRNASTDGMALPVVLIILAVMLLGGVYLLRSVNSTALTTGNLANDTTLSHEADLGLHTAFAWLSQTAKTNKAALNLDDATNGYVATWDPLVLPRDATFWAGSHTIAGDEGTSIEYVIHRLCASTGGYSGANRCMQTAANTATAGSTVAVGDSLAADAPAYASTPQLHYVITARITGGRGANVTNQMIVLIGA
jgi:Tfp pilus assembly protein PilX